MQKKFWQRIPVNMQLTLLIASNLLLLGMGWWLAQRYFTIHMYATKPYEPQGLFYNLLRLAEPLMLAAFYAAMLAQIIYAMRRFKFWQSLLLYISIAALVWPIACYTIFRVHMVLRGKPENLAEIKFTSYMEGQHKDLGRNRQASCEMLYETVLEMPKSIALHTTLSKNMGADKAVFLAQCMEEHQSFLSYVRSLTVLKE